MNTGSQDQLKIQLEGRRIKSINFSSSSSEKIIILDIDLDSGDKLVFGDNNKGTIISIKKARDIEIESIKDQLSQLQLKGTLNVEIQHINRGYLESLARERAEELGHPDPFNVVLVNGSNFKIDFTFNNI